MYVYDPWSCGFQGTKDLEKDHDISTVSYMGWFNLLKGLSEHDERKLFEQVNRGILEQIVGTMGKDNYDAIIIDGKMAYVLCLGYYLLDDVLERSPESLDGSTRDLPLVIANPIYGHDKGLHWSGSDFGIREGVDVSGAIDGLLQDPIMAHPAIVYNEDFYRKEGRLIVPK